MSSSKPATHVASVSWSVRGRILVRVVPASWLHQIDVLVSQDVICSSRTASARDRNLIGNLRTDRPVARAFESVKSQHALLDPTFGATTQYNLSHHQRCCLPSRNWDSLKFHKTLSIPQDQSWNKSRPRWAPVVASVLTAHPSESE